MKTLTLYEARKRSGLDLLNDKQVFCYNDYGSIVSVSQSQKQMARRYPLHEEMVQAGKRFFASKGFEIYPRGLTVDGVQTCPDFALFRQDKIVFVECLTAGWTNWKNIRKKARLAKYGRVAFIVEHPEFADLKNGERKRMISRLRALSKIHPVYLYHPAKRALSRLNSSYER